VDAREEIDIIYSMLQPMAGIFELSMMKYREAKKTVAIQKKIDFTISKA
jgi:hypothetical protein